MIVNPKVVPVNYTWLRPRDKEKYKIYGTCFACSEKPCIKETCQCDCHKKEK